MRNGQNKHHRMRGRNRGKSNNPLTRVYESNGPDVKIRGTANHVAEKYIQLARDATASGDPVAAENYYQHAEHYFRLIAAAQEQFRQSQPFNQQRPEGGEQRSDDQNYDDGEEAMQPHSGEPHSPRDQQPYQQQPAQPYQQREQQSYQPREQQHREHQQNRDHQQRGNPQYRDQQRDNQHQPRQDNQPQQAAGEGNDVSGLPSFITGGQPPQNQAFGQQNGYDNQPDRFPLHRRRRRGHRGPRPDMPGGQQGASGSDGPEDTPPGQPPVSE